MTRISFGTYLGRRLERGGRHNQPDLRLFQDGKCSQVLWTHISVFMGLVDRDGKVLQPKECLFCGLIKHHTLFELLPRQFLCGSLLHGEKIVLVLG